MENKPRPVTVFELELTGKVDMSGHRPYPAHLAADNGDRFPVDHRLKRHLFDFAGLGKDRAPRAACIVFSKGFLGGFQLLGNFIPLQVGVVEQILQIGPFQHQRIAFADQLKLFETAQRTQPHV